MEGNRRIVLTGGPGSGKTAITTALATMCPGRFVRVPEAATQVYEQLQARWDQLDVEGRRGVQRQIYALQIEQEHRLGRQHPHHALLLDRGSIDGAAYWPEGPEDYWRQMGTRWEAELARYSQVIWLESCAVLGVYDGASSNPRRHEDAAGAIAAGQKVHDLWQRHQRFAAVRACDTIDRKIRLVLELIEVG